MLNIKELIKERMAPVMPEVKSIAWDGCHKIYVLLDDEQTAEMRGIGYGDEWGALIETNTLPDRTVLDILEHWFRESCGLVFINSVRTVAGNPNDGFGRIIEQGDEGIEWDYDEDAFA